MTNANLIEIAKILTNNNQKYVDDITEMTEDIHAFYTKHKEWFDDELSVLSIDEVELDRTFVYWLLFKYSADVDWKEYINEILGQLEGINKNLDYPLDIDKIEIDREEETFKAFQLINTHFSARGYKLVTLESGGDNYYLFIAPEKECGRLEKLGMEIGFDFSTFY